MKWPEEIRSALRSRWDGQWRSWLGGGGEWPQRFALGAPSEAGARAQWEEFRDWIDAWRNFEEGQVTFGSRRWPALGAQEVPTHVSFESPMGIAAALGARETSLWDSAEARFEERLLAWPECEDALRRIAPWMGSASPADYARFVSVVDWLAENPDSGLWLRQLPIPGLDTKWVEVNTGALRQVLACRLGRDVGGPFPALAGLAVDSPRRRLRLLDPALRAELGGLEDITLGLDTLARLELPVRAVLVVENLQTALAFGDLPGTLLFVGGGFAVAELRVIPWLAKVPLLYWGDIDNAGFAILNMLRQDHPHARSVLMDELTFLRHKLLWSRDESRPGATLPSLTADELALYSKLGAGAYGPAVRLEQERIEWRWATERITEELANSAQPVPYEAPGKLVS